MVRRDYLSERAEKSAMRAGAEIKISKGREKSSGRETLQPLSSRGVDQADK
jgi:hypothetical protein